MATIQRFEELEVWKKARMLSQKIYPLTFKDPVASDFRLKDQLRGSAGSIMDNIAEGFKRGSKLEFIHSLAVSKGETGERNHSCTGVLTISIFLNIFLLNFTNWQMRSRKC